MTEAANTPESVPGGTNTPPPVTPPADPAPSGWGRVVWLIAFVVFTAVDLGTKSWAFAALGADVQTAYIRTGDEHATFVKPPDGEIAHSFPAVRNPDEAMTTVIPGCFDFQASINTGAVFGILAGRLWVLMGFTVVAIGLIGAILWKADPRRLWLHFAFGLICSGAAGNLYDRIVFSGVRDFIKWYAGSYVWPTFNIADAALVVGIGIIIIAEFQAGRDAATTGEPASAAKS